MFKGIFTAVLALGLTAGFAEEAKTEAKPAKKVDLVDGKKVFETNCVLCHGASGKGDGAGAAALNPKPRNFTDTVRMASEGVEKLRKVIAKGGASVGLSPLMPAWKGPLKDNQIDNVLAYILKTYSGEGSPKWVAAAKAAEEKKEKK